MRSGACVLVLLACALPAQRAPSGLRTPEDQLAALAGDDATRAAWAAHLLRGRGDASIVKPLREALKHWHGVDAGSREARLHVLDALIGVNASVPSTYVLPLVDDPLCGVAAFVLLAREPRHNEKELLDLFQRELRRTRRNQPLPPRAAAIGTLLAEQRTPGFAKSVVERVDVVARIVVGDGGIRGSVRFQPIRDEPIPDAMPPRPVYSFAREAVHVRSSVAVVITAPLNGRVLRDEMRAGDAEAVMMAPTLPQPPDADCVEWLAAMSRQDAPRRTTSIRFRDDAAFVAEATAARDERQRWFDTLRERLVADGVLTADEAKPLARAVEVTVDDQRADPSKPLPRIPPPK